MTILITGGAGFIGSHLALALKEDFPHAQVIAFDNLNRRGSELNLSRLKVGGVQFRHGDVRNTEDLGGIGRFDLLIDCSAEPSVGAAYDGALRYVIQTNLVGTCNCLEFAARYQSDVVFLSTSRVYSCAALNSLSLIERPSRFELAAEQTFPGVSEKGVSEDFPVDGHRSFYGTTKLASELLIQEAIAAGMIRGTINRCGVIGGPWQMGKTDQGIVGFWLAQHHFGRPLGYIGYGGTGNQVRDVLHVHDLCQLIRSQVSRITDLNGQVFNVGGGLKNSISLTELTDLCRRVTGKQMAVGSVQKERPGDIPYYVSDCSKIGRILAWSPSRSVVDIVEDTFEWMANHEQVLRDIFCPN